MERTITVVCRSCGSETRLRIRRGGVVAPDVCRRCESTDLVELADLSPGELAEVERRGMWRGDARSRR